MTKCLVAGPPDDTERAVDRPTLWVTGANDRTHVSDDESGPEADANRVDASRAESSGNPDHPAVHRGGLLGLALGAIGVESAAGPPLGVGAAEVFGDIGTRPLYSMQTVFAIGDNTVKPTPADVYGVVSLIFWSITLIVTA